MTLWKLNNSIQESYLKKTAPFIISIILILLIISSVSSQEFQSIKDGFGEYVLIPAGELMMGDNFNVGDEIERPVHTVYLDSFYIGKYEVTNLEYKKFMDDKGYTTQSYWSAGGFKQFGKAPAYWKKSSNRGGNKKENFNFPVTGISWYEAMAYCAWLSVKTGKTYRLPTEAEWEKAARGTDQRRYPWGNKLKGCYANFYNSGDPHDNGLTPVGYYDGGLYGSFSTQNNSSPYGVYDMAGNVWEWCFDWYNSIYYALSPDRNPTGPPDGKYRVIRGGGWFYSITYLSASSRGFNSPDNGYLNIGFRCVRTVQYK